MYHRKYYYWIIVLCVIIIVQNFVEAYLLGEIMDKMDHINTHLHKTETHH